MKINFEFETWNREWKNYKSHNIITDCDDELEIAASRAFKCENVKLLGGDDYFDVWKWDFKNRRSVEKLGRIRCVEKIEEE